MSPFSQFVHYIDGINGHFPNHLFSNYFSSSHHSLMNYFVPRFDLEENDHFYYLCGEIPGVKADDISIEARDSYALQISGVVHRYITSTVYNTAGAEDIQSDDNKHSADTPRSKNDHNQQGNGVLLSERLVGGFHRSFYFPSAMDKDAITASLKDGLLRLQIPKWEVSKPMEKARRVPVITEGN